jgi:hypothetical protein
MAYAPLSLLAGTGTIRGRKPSIPTGILLWNQFNKSSSQNQATPTQESLYSDRILQTIQKGALEAYLQ